MRYGITTLVLRSPGLIEITQQEYEALKSARRLLFEALYLEEKFDLVTENYFEYETDLLALSTRYMIFRDQNYSWFRREQNLISRRVINLLDACRLYLDQSKHHLHNIYDGDSPKLDDVEAEKSAQYDCHLGYRAMEALRNYVQHRGIPIQTIIFNATVVGEKLNRVRYVLTPQISVVDLEDDPTKFKRSVLTELKKFGSQIDIKPLIREYMECLGTIHAKVRGLIHDDVVVSEERINSTIESFRSIFGRKASIAGLAIVAQTEEGAYSETQTIFQECIERRHELERKNRFLPSLTARYVSNEILDGNINENV